MSNLYLLIKIQFQTLLKSAFVTKNRKKKAAGLGTILLIAGVFIYMSVVYTFGMVEMFPEGYKYITLYVMGMITILILFIFGYQSAGGHLFGYKDFDLLMSLPLTKQEVLSSKFISFLVLEYFYGFFVLAPAIVIVGIVSNYGPIYYLFGLITWLVLPIVPMVLASIFAYFAMYMAGKFKYKNLMNNIFYIVLMGLVFVLSFSYQILLESGVTDLLQLLENYRLYMPFMTFLFDGMIFKNFLNFIIGILMNVIVLVLFIWIFSKQYMKLNGQIQTGYKVKNFKLTESKKQSVFQALFIKELRTYFSNTVYFMNTAIMPILMIIGFGYLTFFMKEELTLVMYLLSYIILPIFCGIIFMMNLMSCTTNSSISLEGKNFDVLKSYPIDPREIFYAKMAVNFVVILPFGIICSLLAIYTFQFDLIEVGLSLLTVLTSGYFISALGLFLNLHFYRFDWDNAAAVVKQSMPVFITTLGGMVAGIIIIGVGVALVEFIHPNLVVLLLNLILLLIDGYFYYYFNHGGIKQFYKIN